MKWNQQNKIRLYAALHKKLQTIRDEVPKPTSQDKYNDFLDSCGILRVITAWSGPEPAETENNIIIPNPLFSQSYYDVYGKNLGLCMPEEVALKILAIGLP